MAEIDLNFLAQQLERLLTNDALQRDDMRVLTAIVMRLDNTRERHEGVMTDILHEMRAIHMQIGRMNDRITKLEEGVR